MSVRILVVDNSEAEAVVLRDHLITQEYDVEILGSSRETYDLLVKKESTYDLLIFDMNLSGLDGVTLAKRLRQKGVPTPVLLTSTGIDPAVKLSIVAMGPSVSYMDWGKGGSRELLLAACTDLLTRNQYMATVCKLSNRLDDLHTLILERLTTREDVCSLIQENRKAECPVYHSAVKEDVSGLQDRSAAEIETKMAEGLEKVTKDLTKAIEEATDAPKLLTKIQEHPVSRAIFGLLSVIFSLYMGFSWYSYSLADQSSRGVTEVRFQVQELSNKMDIKWTNQEAQMTRIERSLSDLVDDGDPRRRGPLSSPRTPMTSGRNP